MLDLSVTTVYECAFPLPHKRFYFLFLEEELQVFCVPKNLDSALRSLLVHEEKKEVKTFTGKIGVLMRLLLSVCHSICVCRVLCSIH